MDILAQKNAEKVCYIYMMILNFIIVIFQAMIIYLTQFRVAKSHVSIEFCQGLNVIPSNPYLHLVIEVGTYLIICYCIYVKTEIIKDEYSHYIFFTAVEFIAAFILMFQLSMSSSGIVFLFAAELLPHMSDRLGQIIFVVFSFVFYLVCNYNVFSMFVRMNSLDMWIGYYDTLHSNYYYILIGILDGLNILLFLIYVIILLLVNKKETEEIRILNRDLHVANDKLLAYAEEKEQMGETKERNRIAREIHDTIGHSLTGISVGVEAVQVLMDLNPEMAKQQLTVIGDSARGALEDVRRSVRKLAPDALNRFGLKTAIYKLVEETSKVTGTKILFVPHVDKLDFEPDEEDTIYRVIQESVTNAIRHGKATEIWIHIRWQDDALMVMVQDNGIGITGDSANSITEGFGLTHMRERVELLGGELSFGGMGNVGFSVIAKIPIRQADIIYTQEE